MSQEGNKGTLTLIWSIFLRSRINDSRRITMLTWKRLLPGQDLAFLVFSVFLFNLSFPSSLPLPCQFSQLHYVRFHCLTPFLQSPLSSVFLQRWAGLEYDNMPHGKKFSLKKLAPTFWVQITCAYLTFIHCVGAGVYVPTQIRWANSQNLPSPWDLPLFLTQTHQIQTWAWAFP